MADYDAGLNSSGSRARIPLIPRALWAKALAKTAAQTLVEELTLLAAKQQEQRQKAEEQGGDSASTSLRDRVLQLILRNEALRAVDPEVVVRWLEAQGAETWLLLMTKWERVSREVVDELLQTSPNDSTQRSREYFKKLQRWEGAANFVIEKVVDYSLDTPDARRARRYRGSPNDEN